MMLGCSDAATAATCGFQITGARQLGDYFHDMRLCQPKFGAQTIHGLGAVGLAGGHQDSQGKITGLTEAHGRVP